MAERREDFAVTIRVNFNRQVYSARDEFFQELSRALRRDSRFSFDFHPIGKWGGPNDSVLSVCDAASAEEMKLQLTREALNYGFPARLMRQSLSPHNNVCYAGRQTSIVVGSDGKLYKCTVAFADPRNHVGRITEEGDLLVDEGLWNLWTQLDEKDTHKCSSCSFNPSCQSRACPLMAIIQRAPPCPMTETEYPAILKIAATSVQERLTV
jgi:uncharacterized protein